MQSSTTSTRKSSERLTFASLPFSPPWLEAKDSNNTDVHTHVSFAQQAASITKKKLNAATPSARQSRTGRNNGRNSRTEVSFIPDPVPSPVHPYAEQDYFKFRPPIPEFNYIIDPETLEILEDLTGQP